MKIFMLDRPTTYKQHTVPIGSLCITIECSILSCPPAQIPQNILRDLISRRNLCLRFLTNPEFLSSDIPNIKKNIRRMAGFANTLIVVRQTLDLR